VGTARRGGAFQRGPEVCCAGACGARCPTFADYAATVFERKVRRGQAGEPRRGVIVSRVFLAST